jgi:hypothetical protein
LSAIVNATKKALKKTFSISVYHKLNTCPFFACCFRSFNKKSRPSGRLFLLKEQKQQAKKGHVLSL